MATQTSTSARFAFPVHGTARPNMRLKLPGGERSKGSGVLCAGAHNYRSITDALAGESPAA